MQWAVFHDLRYTFASLFIQQKAHLKYIQEQLGHGSMKVTMGMYLKAIIDTLFISLDDSQTAT